MENAIVKEEYVFIDNVSTTKEECLRSLAKKACEFGLSSNAEDTYQGFCEREKESSTGFTDGIAIPHTRCSSVKNVGLMVMKTTHDIDWDSLDGIPTNIIFAILVAPAQPADTHIKVLSTISRGIIKEEFRNSLKQAENCETLYNTIKSIII